MEKEKQDKPKIHNKHNNRIVCFLCGREGHYGSPTSCYALKHVRKHYFN